MLDETPTPALESEATNPAETETVETPAADEYEGFTSPDVEPEADAETPEGEAEAVEGEAEGEGEPAPEPEYVSVEFEGKEYELPPELKDAFLRNKDYTQKNQLRAERERQLDQREQEISRLQEVSETELQSIAQLQTVNQSLETYQGLTSEDWQQLEQQDPIGAQSHWREYQMLEKQQAGLHQNIQQARFEREQHSQSETTKRLQETEQFAREQIPGWNNEVHSKIEDFAATELALPKEQLRHTVTPQVYKALHLAWVGHQSLRNQATAKPAAASLKPTTRVTAKSTGTKHVDPASMSMDDYAKWAGAKYKD